MPNELAVLVTAGRIVHYVRPDGTHVAALVTSMSDFVGARVNLTLFLDGGKIEPAYTVIYDPIKEVGTWHWPERKQPDGTEEG